MQQPWNGYLQHLVACSALFVRAAFVKRVTGTCTMNPIISFDPNTNQSYEGRKLTCAHPTPAHVLAGFLASPGEPLAWITVERKR